MTENPPVREDNPIPISIVLISTEDCHGGAGIACYRLFSGLTLLETNVRMLVKNKRSTDQDIIAVSPADKDASLEAELFSELVHQECVNNNRTALSNSLLTYPIFGYDFKGSEVLKNADIINLHWINFFCSLSSLKTIAGFGKPVVWTLHDQWLLTGGCHYTSGCEKFLAECRDCPQLERDDAHLPQIFLPRKRELVREMHPVIVTPSHWLAHIVKRLPAFEDMRVEVIPNSVDTSIYSAIPKRTARGLLNLPSAGFYVLFSLHNAFEKRMGVHSLINIIRYCMEDPLFSKRVRENEIRFLCSGDPGDWTGEFPVPLLSLGTIRDDHDLSVVYSCADVFLSPSLEHNLPNMVLEAMSCGTPSIAFDTGGMPDMIQHGVNGYLAENGSERAFARLLLDMCGDTGSCARMSEHCRTIALQRFSLEVQARRYLELYSSLVNAVGMKSGNTGNSHAKDEDRSFPDASDIDNDPVISEVIRKNCGRFLLKKELELRRLKAIEQELNGVVKKLRARADMFCLLHLIHRLKMRVRHENRN